MSRKALVLLALIPVLACNKSKTQAPAPEMAQVPGAAQAVKGTVLERLSADPYTYLRLKTAQGEVWAAVPTTDAAVGSEVSFIKSLEQVDWDSPKLKRKFDRLQMGTLVPAAGAGAMTAGATAMPGIPGHPPVANTAPTAPTEIGQIAKFEGAGGYTVAELYAKRASLAGKTIAVRGRVMKVTTGITVAGIPGATWLHVQDGSGNAARNDNDLTVTTDDAVAVGDLVVVKGTLQADPKIGPGYERAMVIQGAKVTK